MWLWVLQCTKAQQCFRWPSFLCCPFPSTEHTHKNIGWWHGKVSVSFILCLYFSITYFFSFSHLRHDYQSVVKVKWSAKRDQRQKSKAKLFYHPVIRSVIISLKFTPGPQAGAQADIWQLDAIAHDKLSDLVFILTLVSPWTLSIYNGVFWFFSFIFFESIHICMFSLFSMTD